MLAYLAKEQEEEEEEEGEKMDAGFDTESRGSRHENFDFSRWELEMWVSEWMSK
jgi:hypothetical protein